MKRFRFIPLLRLLASLGLFGGLGLTSGCLVVAVGAGAGAVAYVQGELKASIGHDYNRVDAASVRALNQLEFRIISQERDALSDKITARTGQDKKVVVVVKRQGDNVASVSIRVGLVGNEATSRSILDQINRDL